jgi:putative Mg2+ transporter-C (MgtC) family protein
MDALDAALRLGAATLAGGLLGLNRDLHDKPTGVRTLGLVSVGAALIVLVVTPGGDVNAMSRVIQGILTGIGFLGAGVIIRNERGRHVHGLTTAACVWLAACMGATCGAGGWRLVAMSVPFILIVLILGGPVEKVMRLRWGDPDEPKPDP